MQGSHNKMVQNKLPQNQELLFPCFQRPQIWCLVHVVIQYLVNVHVPVTATVAGRTKKIKDRQSIIHMYDSSTQQCMKVETTTIAKTRTATVVCMKSILIQKLQKIWRNEWIPIKDNRIVVLTRKWADAQRVGRPAEYRWCLLFNAAKFGWRPLPEWRAVTLPRSESRWKLLGCPKLSTASAPKFAILWEHVEDILLLNKFFPIVDTCLSCEDKVVWWCPDGDFFASFLRPVFPPSRVQHISDLHSKFALGPHHV